MRAGLLLFIALVVTAQSGLAQVTVERAFIATDRPDFTEGAVTVPKRAFQMESGYTVERARSANNQTLGEFLFRMGAWEPVEIRVGINSYAWVDGPRAEPSGWENPKIGTKLQLYRPEVEEPGWNPAVALIVDTTVPLGSEVSPDAWEPGTTLAVAWLLSENLSLGSNLGVTGAVDDDERFTQGKASVALGIGLSESVGTYIETYATFPDAPNGPDNGVLNGGFTFLLQPNIQLDARVGVGLTEVAPDFVFGAGFSGRW